MAVVARDLDLTESALRRWFERERADRSHDRTARVDTLNPPTYSAFVMPTLTPWVRTERSPT